jgi:hypothetical protein
MIKIEYTLNKFKIICINEWLWMMSIMFLCMNIEIFIEYFLKFCNISYN